MPSAVKVLLDKNELREFLENNGTTKQPSAFGGLSVKVDAELKPPHAFPHFFLTFRLFPNPRGLVLWIVHNEHDKIQEVLCFPAPKAPDLLAQLPSIMSRIENKILALS